MNDANRSEYLSVCPRCGCRELFVRKDFPQKIGMGIVVAAAASFLVLAAWRSRFYLGAVILIAAAMVDAMLYFLVGRVTVCYRCRAEFRGPINPDHHGFDLATGEKYRQVSEETK